LLAIWVERSSTRAAAAGTLDQIDRRGERFIVFSCGLRPPGLQAIRATHTDLVKLSTG
jgi:hypothetical protein